MGWGKKPRLQLRRTSGEVLNSAAALAAAPVLEKALRGDSEATLLIRVGEIRVICILDYCGGEGVLAG